MWKVNLETVKVCGVGAGKSDGCIGGRIPENRKSRK
jgi:hypothetical protein